jgi:lantibiotic modifying enzyme
MSIPKSALEVPRFFEPAHRFLMEDYLGVALSSERWIATGAHPFGQGIAWYDCPERPEQRIDALASATGLYAGSAGILLFYLALYQVTGEQGYLQTARAAGDGLISTYQTGLDERRLRLPEALPGSEYNYCAGAAGEGFALARLAEAAGEPAYLEQACRIADDALEAARSDDSGIYWTGEPGIMLDGGIVLYLLDLAKRVSQDAARQSAYLAGAKAAALHIAKAGSPDPRGGWHWLGMDPAHAGMEPGTYWPGFEYGTAGIGYLLALAGEATNDLLLRERAEAAAAHIQAIATVDGDAALVFYNEPANTDLYYVGNCNGAAGHAKFFYQMYKSTGAVSYLDWAERFAAGTHQLGAPQLHSPGFWQTQCHCCGDAALLEMDLGLWAATEKEHYLADARACAATLIGHGYNADQRGYRWYQAFTRLEPDQVAAYSGFYPGAAGDANALLQLYTAEQGDFKALRLLDDPWPEVVG